MKLHACQLSADRGRTRSYQRGRTPQSRPASSIAGGGYTTSYCGLTDDGYRHLAEQIAEALVGALLQGAPSVAAN
jgi:hypothetical protein